MVAARWANGIIELRNIPRLARAGGYAGAAEVEILSEDRRARPLDYALTTCIERH